MANVVVVGAQWGDEGKGKIVDWLSERADVIARSASHPTTTSAHQITRCAMITLAGTPCSSRRNSGRPPQIVNARTAAIRPRRMESSAASRETGGGLGLGM